MQTPHSGMDFAVDGWLESSDAESGQRSWLLSQVRRRLVWMGLVIATAVVATSSDLLYRMIHERYSTQLGQMGLAELPDGSMAILNTSSEIELAFTRNVRRVRLLRGEVLFDVAPDPKRSFVAEAAGFSVETQGTITGSPRRDGAVAGWLVDYARDVATPLTRRTSHTLFATRGTTFTLRYMPRDTLELVVLEGCARIRHRAPGNVNQAPVSQDTVVVSSTRSSAAVTRVSAPQLAGRVAWLDRSVVLTANATVRDAAHELNRYNEIKLLVQGSVGDVQIRGRFNVRRPEDFAATMAKATGAHVQFSGNLITIGDLEAQASARR